jgi:hypothetical protein
MDSRISTRFLNGLMDKHDMDLEDIKDWIYCGGDFAQHSRYFKLCYPDKEKPDHEDECICNTKIGNNCYIRKDVNAPVEDILVVGSCCITKFLPNGFHRMCEKCNEVHKRRTKNICKECEKKQKDENDKLAPYAYFAFPYGMKEEVKTNGAKWNFDYELYSVRRVFKPQFIKKYEQYIVNDPSAFIAEKNRQKLQKIEDAKLPKEFKVFTFANKDQAKLEGYEWDNNIKKWWRPIREIAIN